MKTPKVAPITALLLVLSTNSMAENLSLRLKIADSSKDEPAEINYNIPSKERYDFSSMGDDNTISNPFNGITYDVSHATVVDSNGNKSLNAHRNARGLENAIVGNGEDIWRVKITFAEPYVKPHNSIWGFAAKLMYTKTKRYAIYRDGETSDGYLAHFEDGRGAPTNISDGATYAPLYGRIKGFISEPVKTISWDNKDGRFTVYVNGNKKASWDSDPERDNLDTISLIGGGNYTNGNVHIKSIDVYR